MLISQGFNLETSSLTTFVEHCERAETTDAIASAKFVASDEEHEPKTKKRSKSKLSMIFNSLQPFFHSSPSVSESLLFSLSPDSES